jgi:metallo-beta-lactamase class B
VKPSVFASLIATITLLTAPPSFAAGASDPAPKATPSAEKWNQPQTPVKIHGDSYYVGVAGLSSVLIRTDAGLILLDGDLPQSVPLIEANIRALGFKVEDIKLILNSHAHRDHAGGIAALQHDSGGIAVASPSGAQALRDGHIADDDPQVGYADTIAFPAVAKVREVRDGEVLHLGKTAVTAHFTPGHTPGSTTWTWLSCEAGICLNIVYADSLYAVAAPGFHFLADATHGDLTARFRKSIQTVADLPCDILISVHPDASGFDKKLRQFQTHPTSNPFIDAQACRAYAADNQKILDARIAEEKAAAH